MSSWAACRFLTCSVLPVRLACQCACPFCFSRSSVSSLEGERAVWSDDELLEHYRWAAAQGATRLVVTGGGEPLLRADACIDAVRLGTRVFGEIALFTNGALLSPALARELRAAGLSYVCWSRHAADDDANRAVMGDAAPEAAAVLDATSRAGLAVRATCVMHAGGVQDAAGAWAYIDALRDRVGEFTFKHTYVARSSSLFASSAANAWSRAHRVDTDPFAGQGTVVGALPWGPQIRRIGGVQVCHYYEPTPAWELQRGLARSSNLLSDGSVYASLEDRTSLLARLGCSPITSASRPSTPVTLAPRSHLTTSRA